MATEILFLRCNFSEEEMKQLSLELARAAQEETEAEEEKKATMAQFAESIASCKAKVSSLARKINNGYEMRNVECEVRLDDPSAGMATVVRLDTGETSKVRQMTAEEMQPTLELRNR